MYVGSSQTSHPDVFSLLSKGSYSGVLSSDFCTEDALSRETEGVCRDR